MSDDGKRSNRRQMLKTIGVLGAAATLDSSVHAEPLAPATPAADGFRQELQRKIDETTIADTHEHLPDEAERLRGQGVACDDWAGILSNCIESDLQVAGMPPADMKQLQSRKVDPLAKWPLIAPYWPAVKNTGYGRVIRIAIKELYGIEELDEKAIPRLQQGYESLRKPGFYQKVLGELARIESSQVNCLSAEPFHESSQPSLLLQDISIVGMHIGPDLQAFGAPTGIQVRDLSDWHSVIRWWFEKYGPYAVAVKSQAAYVRRLDYDRVPAEKAEPVFGKVVQQQPVSPEEKKLLEDHLFWYAVDQATKHSLPVKLHTGYYAGTSGMPLDRLAANPSDAAALCRNSPETRFVFMHIAYPYWQPMVALAKYYANAYLDMCWAWMLDPVASSEFLKSYLVTAPSNKIFIFGGDCIPVEWVLGHIRMARRGITQSLAQLVDDGWLGRNDALELVEPLLHGNARRFFQLEAKQQQLRNAPWI